jgi:hypothetical protein
VVAEQYSTAQCIHNPAGSEVNVHIIAYGLWLYMKNCYFKMLGLVTAFGFLSGLLVMVHKNN